CYPSTSNQAYEQVGQRYYDIEESLFEQSFRHWFRNPRADVLPPLTAYKPPPNTPISCRATHPHPARRCVSRESFRWYRRGRCKECRRTILDRALSLIPPGSRLQKCNYSSSGLPLSMHLSNDPKARRSASPGTLSPWLCWSSRRC